MNKISVKKIVKTFCAVLCGTAIVFLFGTIVLAADGYVPLAPLTQEMTNAGQTDFTGYASSAISFIVGFSAVLAVLVLVYGGFLYMTGEAIGTKALGKETMQNAIYGLLLILASFVILNTINPDLVNLNLNVCTPGAADCGGAKNLTNEIQPGGGDFGGSGASGNWGNNNNPYGKYQDCSNCIPVQSTELPIKSSNACYKQTTTNGCQINSALAGKLNRLNSLLLDAESQNLNNWVISESWPPTVIHKENCQNIGTCVDVSAAGWSAKDVKSFQGAAVTAGVTVVYECPTCDVESQTPHFSVYDCSVDSSPTSCKP